MMEMLFVISLAAFALGGLVWFAVWAIWIHANAAAYGPAPEGYAAAAIGEPRDPGLQRRLMWYARLKRLTLAFLISTVVLGTLILSGLAE